MISINDTMTREDLKSKDLRKEEFLIYKIKQCYHTNDKRRKFLIMNIKDFSNFIKMEEGKISVRRRANYRIGNIQRAN